MTWKKEYNQKRQTYLAQKQRQRRQKIKEQSALSTQQQSAKYYQAEAIKVLISFKEYTELNQTKRKLWLDFNWTLQDCQKSFKQGYADIVFIMKLAQVADNLIRDFWETAKSEAKQKSKSWNSLGEKEKSRLIKYWGYEKTRIENGYIEEEERLARQSQEYCKEIELAKFHEERGKIKCDCYACTEQKKIRTKIQKEFYNDEPEKPSQEVKSECGNCYQYKKVDPDSGWCQKCRRTDG
jgi:hypothetical protein